MIPDRAPRKLATRVASISFLLVFLLVPFAGSQNAPTIAHDPGVRDGANAGSAIAGLTAPQQNLFSDGLAKFRELASVTGTLPNTRKGLGPRFNALSCAQCHSQPAIGGSSPAVNPQIGAAIAKGGKNQIPSFITARGPVRVVRFPYTSETVGTETAHLDGSVHSLFTITGRSDAPGCKLEQPDFQQAAAKGNLIFRIPTPIFGAGLIEAIPDSAIIANINANAEAKRSLGVAGRPNQSPNDFTITRFGWKAQNKSLEMFAGEANNLELGVTNEIFPNEIDPTPGCQFNNTPEDAATFSPDGSFIPSDNFRLASFTRLLDQPKPLPATPSTLRGQQLFEKLGCALCHTPTLMTGQSSAASLSNIQANLFSDLLLHHMGPKLADNIVQGVAQGDEFRTAPLWGLGQRIFFLHDGRTSDLMQAIDDHASGKDAHYGDSEANRAIENFKKMSEAEKQDLLNFLRSL